MMTSKMKIQAKAKAKAKAKVKAKKILTRSIMSIQVAKNVRTHNKYFQIFLCMLKNLAMAVLIYHKILMKLLLMISSKSKKNNLEIFLNLVLRTMIFKKVQKTLILEKNRHCLRFMKTGHTTVMMKLSLLQETFQRDKQILLNIKYSTEIC